MWRGNSCPVSGRENSLDGRFATHRCLRAPVTGKFVTWGELFSRVDHYSKGEQFSQKKYFSPVLIQRVAYELSDPISQFVDHFRGGRNSEKIEWTEAIYHILLNKPLDDLNLEKLERSD
ncbi:MAG: hypothetical protein R3C11_25510 [Planctomycetaceae bacterium]